MPGNASKDEVSDFARIVAFYRHGAGATKDWPQDAFDAYCMALAVEKLTQPVAA